MRIFFLLLAAFLLFPVSLSAGENEDLFLKIYLPRVGTINLDGVSVSMIPSPIVKVPDRPGEVLVISEDDDKTLREYTKSGWERAIKRRWLRLEFKYQPTIEVVFLEIPTARSGYSYSIYISSVPERAVSFGRLIGPGLIDVLFTYFTVNIVVSESEKIEKMRPYLKKLAAFKQKIRLRGRIVSIETNALHLFDRETQMIEFLDFYLADIEFLN